jgi:hypothetical protein
MWPRAGIGRQSGLKIQWDLFPWRFESARGYQKPTFNHNFESEESVYLGI